MELLDIEAIRGCTIRTKEDRIIGIVKDLVYSLRDLITRYPDFYVSLSTILLEVKGPSYDNFGDDFPWAIIDDEALCYITRSEMDYFEFRKETRPYIEILKELINKEDFERYKFMVHTTPKWKECLKSGVEPRTFNRFHELKTDRKYSMWRGNEGKDFDRLGHVGGKDGSGIIVTKKTGSHVSLFKYLLENKMLSDRLLYVFGDISDWFISFDEIEPKDFIVIYSMDGKRLWNR